MFKKLWDFLFHSCRHKWVVNGDTRVVHLLYGYVGDGLVLQCSNCGNIKIKSID